MKNINWPFIILLSIPTLLIVLIIIIMLQDNNCEKKGGVPTRIGCLDPKVFIK